MKAANVGRFFNSRHKFGRKVWVCYECLEKPKIQKLTRKYDETPIEREVRETLQRLEINAFSEFTLGRYIYDFVVPNLRLIIEADSNTYHQTERQIMNDHHKSVYAINCGFKLFRVRRPDISQQVVHAINLRRRELY